VKYVCTVAGMKAMDADAPVGVPALKSLCEQMCAKDPLIKITYANCQNGDVMPNIPEMSKFWSSMKAAFEIATDGRASPQAALQDAKKSIVKGY
jgi:maltose/maltodextrin transport system substrate-binding protein